MAEGDVRVLHQIDSTSNFALFRELPGHLLTMGDVRVLHQIDSTSNFALFRELPGHLLTM